MILSVVQAHDPLYNSSLLVLRGNRSSPPSPPTCMAGCRRGVEDEVLDEEKHIKSHREESQKELERVAIDALPVVGHGAVHHQLQHRKEAACVFFLCVGSGVEW